MAVFLFFSTAIWAQGLFENAGNEMGDCAFKDKQLKALAISGYTKGALFGGRDMADNAIVSGSYAQAALKLNSEKTGIGRAFAEVRLSAGNNRGSTFAACDVR